MEEEIQRIDMDDQPMSNSGPAYLNNLGKNLLEACRNGYVGQVQRLINFGAPYVEDWLGNSALHFASMNGHVETCQFLLDTGVKRDVRTKVDRTPLHLAAQEGHHDVVELLLKSGADKDAYDGLRMTALHWASEHGHVPVIQMLINYGANPQMTDKFGRTALVICAGKENIESCQMLCRAMYGDAGTEVVLSNSGETQTINLLSSASNKSASDYQHGVGGSVANNPIFTGIQKAEVTRNLMTIKMQGQNGSTGFPAKLKVQGVTVFQNGGRESESNLLGNDRRGDRRLEVDAEDEEEDMGRWPVCMDDENEVRRAARSVLEQLNRLHSEGEESEVKVDGLPNDGGVSWLLNFLELEGLRTEWVDQDEGILRGRLLNNGREVTCRIRITDQCLIFKVVLNNPTIKSENDLLNWILGEN